MKAATHLDQVYVLDEQVGYLLRLVQQRHGLIFQAEMIDGITSTQFSALIRIAEAGRCSQNELGRLAAMDGATIKGVVDRLHQKGLVMIASNPDDKRRSIISLSAKGADLIESLQVLGRSITEETLAPLTATERASFLTLLKKLV